MIILLILRFWNFGKWKRRSYSVLENFSVRMELGRAERAFVDIHVVTTFALPVELAHHGTGTE